MAMRSKRIDNWLGYPLLFVLGVAVGLLVAGYVWGKSQYQFVPREIVLQPPPPNSTWCFPNTSLRGAEAIRAALAGRLHKNYAAKSADSTLIETTIHQLNDSTDTYNLALLWTNKTHYEIVSRGVSDGDITLATEEGTFYLHQIPERFHEKYDSLVAAR